MITLMRTALTRWLLILTVLLCGGRLLAADALAPIDTVKSNAVNQVDQAAQDVGLPPVADHPLIATMPPAHNLLHLQGATPLVGVLLLAVAILPLFFGWRLLRITLAVLSGYVLAIVTWNYGMPYLHSMVPHETTTALEPMLIVATVVAALLGAALGWVLYQLELATVGALLGAFVFAIPASYIEVPFLVWLLIATGFVLGFIAGWVIAPYWAAAQTAILGGVLVAQGILIITQSPVEGSPTHLVAMGIGLSAAVIGFIIQLLWIGRRALTTGAATGRHPRPIVNV